MSPASRLLVASGLALVSAAKTWGWQGELDRCVVRLELPKYPPLARQAGLGGEAVATIRVGRDGRAERVEVRGVYAILEREIQERMRLSLFSPSCQDKTVNVTFVFRIENVRSGRQDATRTWFEPPNKFILSTPMSELNVRNSHRGRDLRGAMRRAMESSKERVPVTTSAESPAGSER